MTNSIAQELVLRTVADLVQQFVVREKDYFLTKDKLEEMVTTGQVTVSQIIIWFAEELEKYFPDEGGGSTTFNPH